MRTLGKSIRCLIVLLLVLSVVSLTSAKTVTKDGITLPIAEKPVTYTWMLGDHPNHPFDASKLIWKEFAKRTNVTIEFIGVPEQSFDEKYSVIIGSRNLPDLMRTKMVNAKRFGVEGAFLPLEKLIDQHTKVLKKLLTPDIRKDLRAADGKIYNIPTLQEDRLSVGWVVRGDWLKKLGLKEPETLDEYYKMLVAFRDKDPDGNGVKDTIPLTHRNGVSGLFQTLSLVFGSRYENPQECWNLEKGKLVYTPTTPQFKEMLQWLNKLYKEDLLDKEFASQSTNGWQDKLTNSKSGAFLDWMSRSDQFNAANRASKSAVPGYDMIVIVPPKGPHGDRLIRTVPLCRWDQSVALSSKIKDPVTILKWLDYRYSSEGILLNTYGIEGVTFKYVNGKPVHVDSILKDPARVPRTGASQDYGLAMPNIAQYEIIVPEFIMPRTREGYAKIAKVKDIYLEPLPVLPYTMEEQQKLISLTATMAPRQEEYMVKFITGEMSFSEWDTFVDAMKKLGSDQVEQIINTAYNRWKKM